MAEMHIKHDDIHGLARTLDELSLPKAQKELLSAIVAAIADAAGDQDPQVSVEVDPVPSFHDQFGTAYTPDQVDNLDVKARGVVSVKVSRALGIGR